MLGHGKHQRLSKNQQCCSASHLGNGLGSQSQTPSFWPLSQRAVNSVAVHTAQTVYWCNEGSDWCTADRRDSQAMYCIETQDWCVIYPDKSRRLAALKALSALVNCSSQQQNPWRLYHGGLLSQASGQKPKCRTGCYGLQQIL